MSRGTEGTVLAHEIRGDGPPLLLIAGTGYPGATWLPPFVDRVAAACTVITFDHAGTGGSPAGDEPLSTRGFATDSVALLDHLGIELAHVLGHSMGGRVAQWMAIDAPQRVRSLLLAATGPGQFREDRPQTRGLPLAFAEKIIELGYERYMAVHIRDTFFSRGFPEAHPEVVDALVTAFWEHRPSLRDYLRHVVARQQHQTTDLLDRIDAPSLVVVGDRDTQPGGTGPHLDQSRFLAETLARGELRLLQGAAHGYFWELPIESAGLVVEWVRRVEDQS